MKSFYFYGHGGSHNHGCEALLTSISQLIRARYPKADIYVSTLDESADKMFISESFTYYEDKEVISKPLKYFFAALRKFLALNTAEAWYTYRNFKRSLRHINVETCFISIGGDNYCCEKPSWLYYMNSLIDKKGHKRVLLGCTIEEKWLNKEMVNDLEGYSLITARDQISFKSLKKSLHKAKVIYIPDTAFLIEPKYVEFPVADNTIGINLSPFAIKKGRSEALKKCYVDLIKYIIEKTSYNILFIPHVFILGNDDRNVLSEFIGLYKDNSRISILSKEYSYAELRFIISKLSMLICARTHASISGYRMGIPTLVLGYSGKSHQLAYELFGTDEGYVVDVNENLTSEKLINSFVNFLKSINEQKSILQKNLSSYMDRIYLPEEL